MSQEQIIESFKKYLEAANIKPESKTALKLQSAYMYGISLNQKLPPILEIYVMSGRSIITGK